ncbi:hypothetical protein Cgig2_020043 [Carnegiea gigantea]|uniref:Uncharacterized protein n=1 Tax=Carnegiea gigantea TaxID=171969 RepID=A0A9Q1GQY4_9CARY|nr:hypothetical protein Cgig2_020043 [Carnegiea gigantea]
MAPPEQPLICEDEGANEKKTYKKAFITRMTTRLFSSLVAQLNEAPTEGVRSMGFASFLKVNLKEIPGKFSKWLFIPAKKAGCESFKRNVIIYLVNYIFNGSKNCYCSKSMLKYVKDVTWITSLDWCQFVLDKLISSVRQYKETKATKGVHFDSPLFFLMEDAASEKRTYQKAFITRMTTLSFSSLVAQLN